MTDNRDHPPSEQPENMPPENMPAELKADESAPAPSIETALEDWRPDELRAAEAPPAVKLRGEPIVTWIESPFANSILEITRAQESLDVELDEEFDEELSEKESDEDIGEADVEALGEIGDDEDAWNKLDADDTMARLTLAMQEEEASIEKELEITDSQNAEQLAELLATQIAEDEALAQVLAAEAPSEEIEAAEELDPELQAALPKGPEHSADGTPDPNYDLSEIESCVEALLFMMDKPVSAEKLHEMLGPDFSLSLFQEALTTLQARYQASCHGIELAQIAHGYQFRTKPGRAALARKLAKVQTQRLSSGAMETLAIIAYRQPVMKDDIDKVRGVDSSHFVRGLLERKLIRISGRSELPGKPMLYVTSPEFLEVFGLKELAAMPSLRELEQMLPASQSKNPDDADEDPRVREMRRLVADMKTNSQSILDYDPKEDERILKEIREKVNAIPTSTPTLEAQKQAEKLAALGGASQPAVPAGLEGLAPLPETHTENSTVSP